MIPVVLAGVAGFGVVFAACGLVLLRAGAPRLLTALTAAVGGLLLLATAVHPVAGGAAVRLSLAAGLVALPVLVLLLPSGRPAPVVGGTVTAVVAATGGLAVAYPQDAEVFGLVVVCLSGTCACWRFETSGPAERTALLWLALGAGSTLLLAGHLTFLVPTDAGAVLTCLVGLALPLALVVGAVRPDAVDVRAAITRTVVEATALVSVIAAFVGALSALEAVNGQRPGPGASGVVAAVCAHGLHPLRVLLLGVVDRLIFGDREDPVRAASHVGRTLEDPVLALRALRAALALPYAALSGDDGAVAALGKATTTVQSLDLRLGERAVRRGRAPPAPPRPARQRRPDPDRHRLRRRRGPQHPGHRSRARPRPAGGASHRHGRCHRGGAPGRGGAAPAGRRRARPGGRAPAAGRRAARRRLRRTPRRHRGAGPSRGGRGGGVPDRLGGADQRAPALRQRLGERLPGVRPAAWCGRSCRSVRCRTGRPRPGSTDLWLGSRPA